MTASKPSIPEQKGVEGKPKGKAQPSPSFGFRFIDVNIDIPLPTDADENSILSKMANGLLRITVNKKPAKNIDINDEQNN